MLPIIATLLSSGLNLLGNAVKEKGQEFIEEKLGVKLDDEVSSEEGLLRLKQLELEKEQMLLEYNVKKAELELADKKLDLDNTQGARNMNEEIQKAVNASMLAKNAAYYLDFIIVCATLALSWLVFFIGVPPENKELIYMALGSLLTMCGTVLNFHRGTSKSSANKDEMIKMLTKGDK